MHICIYVYTVFHHQATSMSRYSQILSDKMSLNYTQKLNYKRTIVLVSAPKISRLLHARMLMFWPGTTSAFGRAL